MQITRRLTLFAAAATPAAAMPIAPTAPGSDAELIRLCDRLVAIQAEETAMFEVDLYTDDDGSRFKPVMDALTEERRTVETRLYDVGGPTTKAGLLAAARAAASEAPKDADGAISCVALAEWLAFGVVERMAGEG
ncbi:MAG TPA: hypothetical protein VFE41_18265 [Acetobacteraceae bacterium]|jgi:hypothetical protein|nr:hypothetical protein [Acetobacteraceae bacterium]